ncbi:hypothetical protein IFR05_000639 [Cadophora sp. M221]|nr:hypothetical protein IFR05_000639 [Cadophora sp. M221]
MQCENLMKPEEDWRELGDPSERRKLQNRIAQRVYMVNTPGATVGRNMRERATKIDQLNAQIRMYEELHRMERDEDSTCQRSPTIVSPSKRSTGGWFPPQQPTPLAGPNDERYHAPFLNDSYSSPGKKQVGTTPTEHQSTNRPNSAIGQRTEGWGPNTQRAITDPVVLAPNFPIAGEAEFNAILPHRSAGISAKMYENVPFDMTDFDDFVDKRQPWPQSEEENQISSPKDSQSIRGQPKSCPSPPKQQSTTNPRPVTRQGPQGGPTSDRSPVLYTADVCATMYEDFEFDLSEAANKSRQSISLLHMAVSGNHIDTIKVLLQDERVVVDSKDSDGLTPLERAVMQGRSEIVKLLLAHSAMVGHVRRGDLPLGAVGGFRTNGFGK